MLNLKSDRRQLTFPRKVLNKQQDGKTAWADLLCAPKKEEEEKEERKAGR
jgi:hypothetical protein